MDSCKLSNSITNNYPNLLEVYFVNYEYLVIDRFANRESYYHNLIVECIKDLYNTYDNIAHYRNPTNSSFKYYLYRGKSFLTLESLLAAYPEALI